MLKRLRISIAHGDAIHLAGAQLALVIAMTAGVAIAAAPNRPAPRLMSAVASPAAAAGAQVKTATVQPASAAEEPAVIRLQDLAPDAARRWNASIPISKLPNPAAKPFHLETEGVVDEARAVDCLTAAIYYEAGQESLDGQRAVAQVVLNRMRHPAFPKTVCGVVFQGSDRPTGCQFTFTCDGALARKPDEASWARARAVAEAALGGYVMKKVGEATHYHAVYVAPYWSPTLVKVADIGAHIFYRWTGTAGRPPAFAGRYAGSEMAGLKMATLDKLGAGSPKMTLAANAAPPPMAAPKAEALATKAAAEPAAAELLSASAVAQDAAALIPPKDLDWEGRPKHTAPRIAIPNAPRIGGSPF